MVTWLQHRSRSSLVGGFLPQTKAAGMNLDDESKVIICKLCLLNQAKYTCPRCHVRYCSIDCYKCTAHVQCSELFYKDCVIDGLKRMRTDYSDKKKVMSMLQRLQDEDAAELSDNEDDIDLAERLDGINLDLDTDKVWQNLTKSEQKEFQTMLEDGRLGNLLEPWRPWWNVEENPLVEEIDHENVEDSNRIAFPLILTDVLDVSLLLRGTAPSEVIPHNIINVLYGYVYVSRLYNGQHLDTASQCCEDLLSLCGALNKQNYSSTQHALHACLQRLASTDCELFVSEEFSASVIADLRCILIGGKRSPLQYVLSALSDLHRLFAQARTMLRETKQSRTISKRLLYGVEKKIEFFISWINTYGALLQNVIKQVELEFCNLSTEISSHRQLQDSLEGQWSGMRKVPSKKMLVQEIT